MSEPVILPTAEDRTLPAINYGLYLLGVAGGLTVLIGLALAYANRGHADPRMQTHYTFQIRTFWLSIGWFLIGAALVFWGGLFSLVLIGLPFFGLGWAILALISTWFVARCIVGAIYLARDEAYPRPYAWLL
jgi:uncharacterized membrane protein